MQAEALVPLSYRANTWEGEAQFVTWQEEPKIYTQKKQNQSSCRGFGLWAADLTPFCIFFYFPVAGFLHLGSDSNSMWPWGESSHQALENCSIFNGGRGGAGSSVTAMHLDSHSVDTHTVHKCTQTHMHAHACTRVRTARSWGQFPHRGPGLFLQHPKIFTSTILSINTCVHRPTLFKKSADLNCLLSGPEQGSLFREINRKEHLQIFI